MRFAILLLAAAVLPSFTSAHAAITDPSNGFDAVWEVVYNASALDPNADTDGDGFTNAQEAAAGTDPRDPASHPPTLSIAVGNGNVTLTWNTVAGKQYRIQSTATQGPSAVWAYLGSPFYGTGAPMSATFGVAAGQTQYYRVQVGDVDSDNDGVSDWDELKLGFDPFRADTFNSGFGDLQAITNALASANTVSVTATHAVGSTAYGDAGVLTFTRTGNFNALRVAYTIGGTAAPGKDYQPLSGSVVFPLTVNTVTVNVTPAAAATFNTPRTVTVTLAAGPGYTVDPNATPATVTFYAPPAARGQVVAEFWDNLDGYDLTAVPFDSSVTTRRAVLTTLELPTNTGLNEYGARIRGYITAPTTGTYTFWCAADDIGEFRLSTDSQMANLVLRAYTESYTDSRQWTKYPTQQSAGIALVAGQKYAFECKFFQDYGGDNFAVGWLRPGQTGTVPSEIVPATVLSNYVQPYNPPGLTTLYFGALDPLSGAPASAQGFANLRLSPDNMTGIFSVSRSGLSGPATSVSVRGPGPTGPLIREFLTQAPQSDGSYLWAIGNAAAVPMLKAGNMYAVVATAAHPNGELAAQLLRSSGTGAFTPPAAPPALPNTAPSAADAARLMTQATFGANAAGIAAIQRDGYGAWVYDQLNAPPTLTQPFIDAYATSGQYLDTDTFQEAWWKNAITAPDQLRQRVAFALSEIMVVSDIDGNLTSPASLAAYYDTLLRDAFGTYRQLLEDVTLHPVMGDYLNMLHNDKADPTTGHRAERELRPRGHAAFLRRPEEAQPRRHAAARFQRAAHRHLRPDGGGRFQPRVHRLEFSRRTAARKAGITCQRIGVSPCSSCPATTTWKPSTCSTASCCPPVNPATQDLKDALDLLSNHPTMGPFFCKQLIQKLVTSNPSPAYVYRVAQVFANNGKGVRGDLRAVVRAILLDYEARFTTMLY